MWLSALTMCCGWSRSPAVFARRDEWVTGWNDQGQAAGLKSLGAELIRGHGRLDGHRRVAVEIPGGGTVALTARHALVICTGSRTALPELTGLAEARPWTNREATDSHAAPGGTGSITPALQDGGEVEADEALFATGRAPRTDDI